MNWEAIGAIGETAGAVGVIVTLIYLAIQVRQNTRSSRLASFQSSTELLNAVSNAIANNDDLAEISTRIYTQPDVQFDPIQQTKMYRH